MERPDSSIDGSGTLLCGSNDRGWPMQVQFRQRFLIPMQYGSVSEVFSALR